MHDSRPVYLEFLAGINYVLLEVLNFFFQQLNINFFSLSGHLSTYAVLLDKFSLLIVNSVFVLLLLK
jgi:hypothetical protein